MMVERSFFVPADTSEPCVMFRGTEEEQEAAERMRQANIDMWKHIINADGFRALQFSDNFGQTVIVSISTKQLGAEYQKSLFDEYGAVSDMLFTTGGNENCHDIKELFRELFYLSRQGKEVVAMYEIAA